MDPIEPAIPAQVAAPSAPVLSDPAPAAPATAAVATVDYERELADLRKTLAEERARAGQLERDRRRHSLLSALADELPGVSRLEIRGAALVAAEDGAIDLYAEDGAAARAHIKTMLSTKVSPVVPAPAPAVTLGGTPGAQARPPVGRSKFLI